MDRIAVSVLDKAGMDPARPELLRVPTVLGSQHQVLFLDSDMPVPVMDEEGRITWLSLLPLAQLWTGSAPAPDFSRRPSTEFEPFFILVEATAADFCQARGRAERDREFQRLYRSLRRRPDGVDPNPLFSYLRAAARLYLSLREVSRPQFDAVFDRLHASAKTFASRLDSTNYHHFVLEEFFHPASPLCPATT